LEKKVSLFTATSTAAFLFVIAWRIAPGDYRGAVLIVLGAALFELGLRKLPEHFRWLSYFVSAAGFLNMFVDFPKAIPLAIATLVCFSMSARLFRAMSDRIGDWEREWCRDLYAAAGAVFAMTLVWLKLPPPIVAPVWTMLGLLFFEIGVRAALPRIRLLAHGIAATVLVRLVVFEFTGLGDALQITYRTFTVVPIIASHYYVWWHHPRTSTRIYLYAPALLFIILARYELGSTLAVVAWALFGLVLYEAGQLRTIADLRWQSYILALLSFAATTDALAENHTRALIAAVVIASLYCAQLLAPRESEGFERYARAFYSMLASLLLAILLYYQVSGSMLTMVWATEALGLLGAGFPLRDRLQRLSGLALFLICVLKLFLYDLRQLETVSRILSFIVLGLILVGVSWMYTRFRDRIQRYL
jgi:uncharacterized membrane protein